MQATLDYRTNRNLFSNYYLNEHLPETEAWEAVYEEELRSKRSEILELWEQEKETAPQRNEASLEEKFIRPLFRILDISFEVQQTVERGLERPDYGFFETREEADLALERAEDDGDFYLNAIGVADAKRWGRPLDSRGERKRDVENPSHQIDVYLKETETRWAVLTNGQKWRLYFSRNSHRLDAYYEIDLPTLLERGDLEDFKYFYLFFRGKAFIEDPSGDSFLDDVANESNIFAQELGEDLQDNIYEAIKVLAEGFLEHQENALSEDDLDLIHDSSLIYLYRVIFVLYAEAEGRELLDTENEIYEDSYSLNTLKQEIAGELESASPKYRDWQVELWSQLDELFRLIDQGSESREIDPDDFYIPAYNGGLFRMDPDETDNREARFLTEHQVGDSYLAKVIELLTRSQNGTGDEKIFVDYSSLDERHLGSIYEGLLEYSLNVAQEPLAVEDGEYVPADSEDNIEVEEGDVYLTTDSGERKATGSYYTPEYVVEYIVENTLGPLVQEIREDLAGQTAHGEGGFAAEFAERVFELQIIDPAMGSGHFLVNSVDYLAREVIDAKTKQDKQALEAGEGAHLTDISTSGDELRDINWARRQVAQRCLYGVDLNPLATELAKVSLWLRTLAAEQPLAFLDHHLKTGNSLVGSDIEDVLENGSVEDETDAGQLTLVESFDRTRRRALDHVTDRFQDLLAIDNETLEDIKEMEAVFDEVRDDPLYRHLLAMANVHTADAFGLDVPSDAYERMAAALRDDSWDDVEEQDWFRSAQAMADEERFFHWELEFPVAFYGEDGERDEDAGFDAVIGNPPYINIMLVPDEQVDYLKHSWDTAFRRFDLYVLFSELAFELGADGSQHSYIVPDKLLTESYGSKWREETLTDHGLTRILDLREKNVFADATNSPIVFVIQCETPSDTVIVQERIDNQTSTRVELPNRGFRNTPGNQIRIDWTADTEELLRKIRSDTFPLSRITYASWGAQPGNASRFVFDEKPDDKEDVKPLVKGSDIRRYSVQYHGRYLWYDQDELHRPAFPELFENEKLCFRKVAGQRGLIGASDDEQYYTEDSVINVIRKADLINADRDLLRARGIEAVDESRPASQGDSGKIYDRDATIYSDDLELSRQVSLKALLGVINSQLINYYYTKAISGQLNVFPEHIRSLPIRYDQDLFADLGQQVNAVNEMQSKKQNLNLNLLDYLGSYTEGAKLPDIGLFQPTSTDILDATTEDHEKLNIGEVRTERDGSSVTIYATARYKPDDEDEHETDRWGYTETGYLEAFTLSDLSENEAALVEAFVPVAVEEGDGFAGFRDNATKTTSLVDRLKAITLPDPDDVEDDLRRYVETKERADELDEKIEKTDQLIDDIVYELYELTDEEIEIVESAVADD